ncbi:TspO/MBR family protein [Spirochaeta isovalerica]|uniref:Lantibiotic ABC transporter permease n=1 Tax=Spirochaeta isovalerica TaxID=150 RepID=A0A841RCU4_9SPIO|nr:TspO/MBR family protein [Spirochaeta isovalerica]MBB6480478.1 hypothetical protein [Spirochaeta isovalerica]
MTKFSKIAVPVSFLAMITINALANILPINGITTGEISDALPNLFTPAGYTFAIWGFIYILLGIFTFKYITFNFTEAENGAADSVRYIGWLFVISSLLNSFWILAWHYHKVFLSLLIMILLFVTLMLIELRIKKAAFGDKVKQWVKPTLSVYFGWITVATVANVSAWLVSIGWNGGGIAPEIWMMILLPVVAVIGTAALIRIVCPAYGMVLIWSYIGILVKHAGGSGYGGEYRGVIIMVIISLLMIVAGIVYTAVRMAKK